MEIDLTTEQRKFRDELRSYFAEMMNPEPSDLFLRGAWFWGISRKKRSKKSSNRSRPGD